MFPLFSNDGDRQVAEVTSHICSMLSWGASEVRFLSSTSFLSISSMSASARSVLSSRSADLATAVGACARRLGESAAPLLSLAMKRLDADANASGISVALSAGLMVLWVARKNRMAGPRAGSRARLPMAGAETFVPAERSVASGDAVVSREALETALEAAAAERARALQAVAAAAAAALEAAEDEQA